MRFGPLIFVGLTSGCHRKYLVFYTYIVLKTYRFFYSSTSVRMGVLAWRACSVSVFVGLHSTTCDSRTNVGRSPCHFLPRSSATPCHPDRVFRLTGTEWPPFSSDFTVSRESTVGEGKNSSSVRQHG